MSTKQPVIAHQPDGRFASEKHVSTGCFRLLSVRRGQWLVVRILSYCMVTEMTQELQNPQAGAVYLRNTNRTVTSGTNINILSEF